MRLAAAARSYQGSATDPALPRARSWVPLPERRASASSPRWALPDGFSRGTFELVVFIGLAVTVAIGVLFSVLGRDTCRQIAPKAAEAPSDATGVAIA